MATLDRAGPTPAAFSWAGYLLGFAMGGFFDGILLHQILQWHHLLSAVEGAPFRDLRVQVLADGLFHAAHYVLATVGLWLLWRSRREFGAPGADRWLFACFLVGFGAWHVVDGLLSHWILGIHRIRMDAGAPLLWDLVFFVPGLVLVAAGWLMRRRAGAGGGSGGVRRAAAPMLLAMGTVAAGSLAALPAPRSSAVTVVFGPGTRGADVFTAVASVDGRVVAGDAGSGLWVLDLPPASSRLPLYRHGALVVGGALLPAGCFSPAALGRG
jgi:uncharacterized membrane protein